jgi:hypothetical protein
VDAVIRDLDEQVIDIGIAIDWGFPLSDEAVEAVSETSPDRERSQPEYSEIKAIKRMNPTR